MSGEQRREMLALGLLALALFLLLALVPPSVFGARAGEWFPSGNPMGVLGGRLQALLLAGLGWSALVLPFLVGVGGVWVGGWLTPPRAVRAAVLLAGLLLLFPPAFHLFGLADPWPGWLGTALGGPLEELVGWLGALLFLLILLLVLLVGTLGWNPLSTLARGLAGVGRGVVRGGGWAVGAVRGLVARLRDGLARRRERRREAMPTPEEEPSFSFGPAAETEAQEEAAPGQEAAAVEPGVGAGEALPAGEAEEAASGPAGEEDAGILPSLEHLDRPDLESREDMERQLDRLGEVLVEKLRTFNVECEIGGRTTGPVVTQFEVVPAPGVKVNRIANLDADLALAMKAKSIRIVAPIPGKGAVGVEIPNPRPEMVLLREILEAPEFRRRGVELPLALGKDLTGRPYVADLTRMPHVLIAGATGSGKSVCLNAFITSLVYRHTPATLRFILIDPKMVELSAYADLPHLRHPVVTDPRDAAGALKWAVLEMERRYLLLSANGVRSLGEFNRRLLSGATMREAEPHGPEGDPDRWVYRGGVLPYIVVVVDELADLMMTVQSEVEKPLTYLAQKARAIGIHLIVATQRPSVNVITGLIKANFPSRIAFRVASKTDSRTILDQNGADALLGNGDMLFLPPGTSEPIRIQGAFISTEETERLTAWYRERIRRAGGAPGPTEEEEDILAVVRAQEEEEPAARAKEALQGRWDELFPEAARICVQQQHGSTSLLQRRLRIGYGRAARIVDQLHEAGILGPPDGSRAREVLVGLDELESLLSHLGE